MEQRRVPYAAVIPRSSVKDGLCEYRVEGNVRDFIRPSVTVELRRRAASPQPSVKGWVSLLRKDGEEAVRAPVQLLWLSSRADPDHPERMTDRYGARLDLGLPFHPRTVWHKGGPLTVEEPLSASIFLRLPPGEEPTEKVALEGGMYRSDQKRWAEASRARHEARPASSGLALDRAQEKEKKG